MLWSPQSSLVQSGRLWPKPSTKRRPMPSSGSYNGLRVMKALKKITIAAAHKSNVRITGWTNVQHATLLLSSNFFQASLEYKFWVKKGVQPNNITKLKYFIVLLFIIDSVSTLVTKPASKYSGIVFLLWNFLWPDTVHLYNTRL